MGKKFAGYLESTYFLGFAMVSAVIAISFAAIFIRLSEATPLIIALYRLFFTFAILLPHIIFWRWEEVASLKLNNIPGFLLSGFFLAGHFFLWISSLDYATVAVSVILVSVHPLLVAAGGFMFLSDPIPNKFSLSVSLVLGGTAVIAVTGASGIGGNGEELIGSILALGGGFMMAGYLLVGRKLRQGLSTSIYAGGTYFVAALLLFIVALITDTPVLGYPLREYSLFLALAIIPTLMGHTVFNWALKKVHASTVSLLFLGEPLGAIFLAFIILHELPTVIQLAGGCLILSGLYIVVKEENKTKNK